LISGQGGVRKNNVVVEVQPPQLFERGLAGGVLQSGGGVD
jgi:hypothetical protein